jgi:hypothetical protein
MGRKLREMWHEFQRSQPGHRFQDYYQRRQHNRKERPWYRHVLRIILVLILILIGIVLVFLPGPAILFFLLAAGLVADRSLKVARGLDWLEMTARRGYGTVKSWWMRTSTSTRAGVVFAAMIATGGAGYLFYRIILRT